MTTRDLVLDSSCWIAWFDDLDPRGRQVDRVAAEYDGRLAVPSIVIFEVDRWMARNGFEDRRRLSVLDRMSRERQIPIDRRVALRAGVLGRAHRLATADALIAGAASTGDCVLATFDPDFANVPGSTVLRA